MFKLGNLERKLFIHQLLAKEDKFKLLGSCHPLSFQTDLREIHATARAGTENSGRAKKSNQEDGREKHSEFRGAVLNCCGSHGSERAGDFAWQVPAGERDPLG